MKPEEVRNLKKQLEDKSTDLKIATKSDNPIADFTNEVIGGALELSYIYPILEKEKSQILSLGLKQKEGESTD